jgi:hypothetical protein
MPSRIISLRREPPASPPGPLTPAGPVGLAEAIAYALRFDLTGKPHGKKIRDDPEAMARAVVSHLAPANYFVFQGPPTKMHTTGDFSRDPGGRGLPKKDPSC